MEGDCGINVVTLRIGATTKKGKGIISLDCVNNKEFNRSMVSVDADEEGQFGGNCLMAWSNLL